MSAGIVDDEVLKVYPTVTRDGRVNIELSAGWEKATIDVVNLLGQQVPALLTGAVQNKTIELKALVPGTYFIRIKNKERIQTFKVVYQP
ncbi:hypothetical protein D3C86_1335790 [compost metagenome]